MDDSQEAMLRARGFAARWVAKHPYLAGQEQTVLIRKFAATARHMGAPVREIVRVASLMTGKTRTRIRQIIYDSTDILRRD
jgi:hypothetical protein